MIIIHLIQSQINLTLIISRMTNATGISWCGLMIGDQKHTNSFPFYIWGVREFFFFSLSFLLCLFLFLGFSLTWQVIMLLWRNKRNIWMQIEFKSSRDISFYQDGVRCRFQT